MFCEPKRLFILYNISIIKIEQFQGTQTVYVKTWGCAHNSSDSEYMAGQLSAYGYKLTDDKWDADLWLLNSCTVKNPAEDHFRFLILPKIKWKSISLLDFVH